jgi:hypothetical protein
MACYTKISSLIDIQRKQILSIFIVLKMPDHEFYRHYKQELELQHSTYERIMINFLLSFIHRSIPDTVYDYVDIRRYPVVSHRVRNRPEDAIGCVGCVEYDTPVVGRYRYIVLHCYIICSDLL